VSGAAGPSSIPGEISGGRLPACAFSKAADTPKMGGRAGGRNEGIRTMHCPERSRERSSLKVFPAEGNKEGKHCRSLEGVKQRVAALFFSSEEASTFST